MRILEPHAEAEPDDEEAGSRGSRSSAEDTSDPVAAAKKKKPIVEINLERALPVDARNSGHFVQGHVDDVGEILKMEQEHMIIYKNVKLFVIQ